MDKKQAHWTLKKRGFNHDPSESRYDLYRGTLNIHGKLMPIMIEIRDWYFAIPPIIRLDEDLAEKHGALPHIMGYGGVCYVGGAKAPVLNFYDPGSTILLCLNTAQKTLEDIFGNRDPDALAEEFFAYWESASGLTSVYYDIQQGFEGTVPYLEVMPNPTTLFGISTDQKDCLKLFDEIQESPSSSIKFLDRNAVIINVNANATVLQKNWPPRTLKDALEWLGSISPSLPDKVSSYLGDSGLAKRSKKGARPVAVNPVFLFSFLNGIFGFIINVPAGYKASQDITRTKDAYAKVILSQSHELSIQRFTGQSMSPSFITERNLDGEKTLSGCSIALIGCGNIGGHLARFLVQAGAGSGDRGELLIIDNDRLKPGNLGRHILGLPFLHQNKSEACTAYLKHDFPTVNVNACSRSVLGMLPRLSSFDLVIDATGEEGLSIALNDYILNLEDKRPAALFVWLEGNGVAARALLNRGPGDACYKCLRPDLGKPERFPALRKNAEPRTVEAVACGDGNYTPYAVGASATAAALGLQVALDFINDNSSPLFRHKIISKSGAQQTKEQDIKPAQDCPACAKLN